MMRLTSSNYHTLEANQDYWSVSQFKEFNRCEAAGLAAVTGKYVREETDALLIGSYVDAYFSGEMEEFLKLEGDKIYQKNGKRYKMFDNADKMIDRVEADPLMLDYLRGEKQVIMSAELFDVPWKIKIDVHGGNRIVDFKTVRDFEPVFDKTYGRRPWIEYWGYDIQGAVYQRIEQIVNGRTEPLPFYLVAVTKEKVPDIAVVQIPQHILDAALGLVEAKIERFDMIKHGEVEPKRCGHCDWCKQSKRLGAPEVYEIEEV